MLPELQVGTRSGAALEAIHRFGHELLSHGCRTSAIFEALSADPECAVAHAYAGALFPSLATRDGVVQALPHIRIAETLASAASERKRQLIAAIACWADGDPSQAARRLSALIERWPRSNVGFSTRSRRARAASARPEPRRR